MQKMENNFTVENLHSYNTIMESSLYNCMTSVHQLFTYFNNSSFFQSCEPRSVLGHDW